MTVTKLICSPVIGIIIVFIQLILVLSIQEAADVCTSITDIDGTPLSLDAVRNRYSGILVDSVALLVDDDSEGNPQTCEMIQFTYEFPDTDDDTGEHLYRVMQAAANPSEEAAK